MNYYEARIKFSQLLQTIFFNKQYLIFIEIGTD